MKGSFLPVGVVAVLLALVGAHQASAAVLHDQRSAPVGDPGARDSSQNFEASLDAFDSFLADDFVVPSGEVWQVRKIRAFGFFEGTATAVDSADAALYSNVGGLPRDDPFSARSALTALGDQSDGELTVPLNRVAPPGTNWVSVQVNLDFQPGERQWQWFARPQVGLPGAYRNPANGFGSGCTTWMRKIADCGLESNQPDQIFLLEGIVAPRKFRLVAVRLTRSHRLVAKVNAPQIGKLRGTARGFKPAKVKVKKVGRNSLRFKPTRRTKRKLERGDEISTKIEARLPGLAGESLSFTKRVAFG